MSESISKVEVIKPDEVLQMRKELREKYNLDISISPMFAKQAKKNGNRHTHTDDGFKSRSYTYAIIESDGDRYRPIDNGHHPWPNFETYEAAEADAVSVSLAYVKKQENGK